MIVVLIILGILHAQSQVNMMVMVNEENAHINIVTSVIRMFNYSNIYSETS